MHKLKVLPISIILVLSLLLAGPSSDVSARPLAATSPSLGAAESYSVLGGQEVTNTDTPTTMTGNLGVYPGSSVTHFPPGIVGGTIHANDQDAHDAQDANTAAFLALAQDCTNSYPGTKDLVGANLVPGVYCAGSFHLTGTLTLSGVGVWIFKSESDLITSGTAKIVGGDPCNVWWRVVSSATLGTNTSLIGNILASTSITMATGASLAGRALAQTGAVTLDNNTISEAICLAPPEVTQTVVALTATASAAAKTATAGVKQTATAKPTEKQGSGSAQETAVAATATALAAVPGLPGTGGGAPIRNEDFPWSLVIVGGFCALALVFGVRAFRRTYRPK